MNNPFERYAANQPPDIATVMVNLTDALRNYIQHGEDWVADSEVEWFEPDGQAQMRAHVDRAKALLAEIDEWFPTVWPKP